MTWTKTLLAASLAAALLAIPAGDAAAGACARIGLEAQVLTHPGDEVPAGGGVLIGWAPRTSYEDGGDQVEWGEDPSVRPAWRFLVRKRKSKPRLTAIAPGLAVYQPGKATGTVSLVDGKGKKVVAVRIGKKKRVFAAAAPEVKAVWIRSGSSSRGGHWSSASAELVAAPPAEAIALVVYDVSGTQPRALTWANVKGATGTEVGIYASPGRCGSLPPGIQSPSDGSKLKLAWVDAFGRVSAMSAEVTAAADARTGGAVDL